MSPGWFDANATCKAGGKDLSGLGYRAGFVRMGTNNVKHDESMSALEWTRGGRDAPCGVGPLTMLAHVVLFRVLISALINTRYTTLYI